MLAAEARDRVPPEFGAASWVAQYQDLKVRCVMRDEVLTRPSDSMRVGVDGLVSLPGSMRGFDIKELRVRELIGLNRATLRELLRRGIVRTLNAPQGDYAERLVAEAYDGKLAPNSEKSWDVLTADGVRLQVKARVVREGERVSARQTSPFRSWEFDAAIIVFLSDLDLSVVQASEIPAEEVRQQSRRVEHVNGWVLTPTPIVMASGQDVTSIIQRAAEEL